MFDVDPYRHSKSIALKSLGFEQFGRYSYWPSQNPTPGDQVTPYISGRASAARPRTESAGIKPAPVPGNFLYGSNGYNSIYNRQFSGITKQPADATALLTNQSNQYKQVEKEPAPQAKDTAATGNKSPNNVLFGSRKRVQMAINAVNHDKSKIDQKTNGNENSMSIDPSTMKPSGLPTRQFVADHITTKTMDSLYKTMNQRWTSREAMQYFETIIAIKEIWKSDNGDESKPPDSAERPKEFRRKTGE